MSGAGPHVVVVLLLEPDVWPVCGGGVEENASHVLHVHPRVHVRGEGGSPPLASALVPGGGQVVLLADRGFEASPDLFLELLAALGPHGLENMEQVLVVEPCHVHDVEHVGERPTGASSPARARACSDAVLGTGGSWPKPPDKIFTGMHIVTPCRAVRVPEVVRVQHLGLNGPELADRAHAEMPPASPSSSSSGR